MHILLTDLLACPRCGPRFGLILLSDRAGNRRIAAGSLGCANCRDRYPIRDGVPLFADASPPDFTGGSPDEALRLAAFMGVTGGPAFVLIAGPAAQHAAAVAELVDDVEVLAAGVGPAPEGGGPTRGAATPARVNVLTVGGALPLVSGRMSGVVLSGVAAGGLLEEGARVVSPAGRLVLLDAPVDAAARLEAAGFRILAAEGATIVAAPRH